MWPILFNFSWKPHVTFHSLLYNRKSIERLGNFHVFQFKVKAKNQNIWIWNERAYGIAFVFNVICDTDMRAREKTGLVIQFCWRQMKLTQTLLATQCVLYIDIKTERVVCTVNLQKTHSLTPPYSSVSLAFSSWIAWWFDLFLLLYCIVKHRRQRFNSPNETKKKKARIFKFEFSVHLCLCYYIIWIGSSITIMWNEFYLAIMCYVCVLFIYLSFFSSECVCYFNFVVIHISFSSSWLFFLLVSFVAIVAGLKPDTKWVTYIFYAIRIGTNIVFEMNSSIGWQRTLLLYHLIYSIHCFFSHEIQLIPTGMGQFEIMHKSA